VAHDLLQGDYVGVHLAQHGRDARGPLPTVEPDTLVHVVSDDPKPSVLQHRPDSTPGFVLTVMRPSNSPTLISNPASTAPFITSDSPNSVST
jgi:hypothetical protein